MAKRRKKSSYDAVPCMPDTDWRARMAARAAASDALRNSDQMMEAENKMAEALLPAVKRAMARVRPFKSKGRRRR